MQHPDGVTRVRLVGGNLALDFTNSRSGPPAGAADTDVLERYDDLVSWAVYAGALTPPAAAELRAAAEADPRAAAATFTRALRVRDDLDDVLRSVVAGSPVTADALARLRDDEAEALTHARLEPGTPFAWSWDDDRSLGRPLWPVIHAALGVVLGDSLARVKQCGGCSFLFLDESKNRSRRWCSMDDCGTDEKMRRYVAARRASRTAAD